MNAYDNDARLFELSDSALDAISGGDTVTAADIKAATAHAGGGLEWLDLKGWAAAVSKMKPAS